MKLFKVYAVNTTPGKSSSGTERFFNLDQLVLFYGKYDSLTNVTHLYLTFSSGETYEVTNLKSILRFCEAVNIMIGDLFPPVK